MTRLIRRSFPVFPVIAILLLAGCQSLQKDLLYSSGGDDAGLAELTELIVPLDREAEKSAVDKARTKITGLEKTNVKNRSFEGRVAAWSGRLFLIEGKIREAEAQFKKAESLYPGSIEGRVLAIRLEGDLEKRSSLCEESLTEARGGGFLGREAEFHIELGRIRVEQKNYHEAVAAFDSAFPRLGPVYRSTYGDARNAAWQLRNLDPETSPKTAEIGLKSSITWEEAITLSRTETALLNFAEKDRGTALNAADLFALLVRNSVIPPGQDISATDVSAFTAPPALYDTVFRSGAAWYLWRLLAENRADKSILTRYSSRYPDRSPIPDLLRRSIFFDAVLGCIEREFMSLRDGKNFNGTGTVGGSEFLLMLKKLEGK
jgi:tetratricopeptide (TPR) repeat protein